MRYSSEWAVSRCSQRGWTERVDSFTESLIYTQCHEIILTFMTKLPLHRELRLRNLVEMKEKIEKPFWRKEDNFFFMLKCVFEISKLCQKKKKDIDKGNKKKPMRSLGLKSLQEKDERKTWQRMHKLASHPEGLLAERKRGKLGGKGARHPG